MHWSAGWVVWHRTSWAPCCAAVPTRSARRRPMTWCSWPRGCPRGPGSTRSSRRCRCRPCRSSRRCPGPARCRCPTSPTGSVSPSDDPALDATLQVLLQRALVWPSEDDGALFSAAHLPAPATRSPSSRCRPAPALLPADRAAVARRGGPRGDAAARTAPVLLGRGGGTPAGPAAHRRGRGARAARARARVGAGRAHGGAAGGPGGRGAAAGAGRGAPRADPRAMTTGPSGPPRTGSPGC